MSTNHLIAGMARSYKLKLLSGEFMVLRHP